MSEQDKPEPIEDGQEAYEGQVALGELLTWLEGRYPTFEPFHRQTRGQT